MGSVQGQQHQHRGAPRYTEMASPSKAQELRNVIPKISFPHTAAASSHQQHLQRKKPSCVCPEALSQQDSLFSWHVPDTSPSLKAGPVLRALLKFPLSSLPASYRHQLGKRGRGKTPALHHTLHNFFQHPGATPELLSKPVLAPGRFCPLPACPAWAPGRAHSTDRVLHCTTAPVPPWH